MNLILVLPECPVLLEYCTGTLYICAEFQDSGQIVILITI